MNDNMKIWDAVKTPPSSALKNIVGGRLKGMTDISPQWRLQALTSQFGPAGVGWTYEITERWTELGPHDQVGAFINILLFVCVSGEWSKGIPGTGGSMLVAQEKSGPYFSDEAFKMATTDAISVAAKALGIGSDVYMGLDVVRMERETQTSTVKFITEKQTADIEALIDEVKADAAAFVSFFHVDKIENLPADKYAVAVKMLEKKRPK